MLPAWFAEYTLYLSLFALVLFAAVSTFGYIAWSRGRFTGLLSDVRLARRPSALMGAAGCVVGVAAAGIAFASSEPHARLAASGLASILLLLAVSTGVALPVGRLWTNEYWGLPSVGSMTEDQARTAARVMGRVYMVFGIAAVVAVAGGLIGIIPKLVYVGEEPIQRIFLVADFAVLIAAGAIAVKAWRLFRSMGHGQRAPLRSQGTK